MLRTTGGIVAVLAGVILLVALIGWSLPEGHVASRVATLAAPPERVYALIADVATYPSWWTDVTRVEMSASEDGRTRFEQHDSGGSVAMEVVEAMAPSRFVTRIADPEQPFGGTWTWEIAPDGSGTRVTLTERGEIYNPIFRFMARFVFGYTSTMERHLAALAAAAR